MPRLVRLRSVDIHPGAPGSRSAEVAMFAKQSAAVTAAYSEHLRNDPLFTRSTWVRFIPTETLESVVWSGIAFSSSDGLGEVHEVPFDPQVVQLPAPGRQRETLEFLQRNLLGLAQSLGWDEGPLQRAHQAVLAAQFEFRKEGAPKWNRRRSLRAQPVFTIDHGGDFWLHITVTDKVGDLVAKSAPIRAARFVQLFPRIARSLKWVNDSTVSIDGWLRPSLKGDGRYDTWTWSAPDSEWSSPRADGGRGVVP